MRGRSYGPVVANSAIIRSLGRQPLKRVWRSMQAFTDWREADTPDELWTVEHEPIFTLGLNGQTEHILDAGDIPVLKIDRGGQATYHGPGQVVIYTLVNLKRARLGVRDMVSILENSVIDYLADVGINASADPKAPGVYVDGAKIAALGLRVRRGCCFHGLALNVAMDLSPFQQINPCGFPGLAVTQLADIGGPTELQTVNKGLLDHLVRKLGYNSVSNKDS